MPTINPDANRVKVLQVVGDWMAPLLAFLVVAGILLALISALLESAH